MAKKNNIDVLRSRDPVAIKVKRFYGIATFIFVLFMVFNMVIINLVYIRTNQVYNTNTDALTIIGDIRNNFAEVNENILLIASGQNEDANDRSEERIEKSFATMDELIAKYMSTISDTSEALQRRFTHATYAIDNYKGKFEAVKAQMKVLSSAEAASLYQQQLEPLQVTADEMLDVAIDIGTEIGTEQATNAAIMHGIAQDILILLLIFMVIGMWVGGNYQIRSMLEVKEQAKELTEASNRLTKSRKKLIDSAMTNILTGMKNRYALDESLAQLMGNAQFNIAVFDIDNFRVINDMYGYEFGDEYLATVAERLKTEYSEHAEMFNITGNEFCMVFYEHVSDLQAQQLSEQIRQGIGQPTNIAGIPVQTTVSASLYHYLPSDNLDVNTLLMKMDTALHAAKSDGGNRMYQIQ